MSEIKIDMSRIYGLQNKDFSSEETQKEIFNIIEILVAVVIEQKEEIQRLRDEIARLKGQKGKPEIKASKTEKNIEIDAKKPTKMENGEKNIWQKNSKKDKIKIDREEVIKFDKNKLPEDAQFKGYEERIVQNIIIKTDNVLYKLEKFYSPSENKTYIAQISKEMKNKEFGAETKALISTLYYENRVTENKIASFLNSNGLIISEGTVSNILITEKSEELTKEKEAIYNAGINCSTYQQIDDTGMRVEGKNEYATIVCNEKYSAFFINPKKNRETVKSIITEEISSQFPVLVCDDAAQFKEVTRVRALCWVHEERHYQKLMPILQCHKTILEGVRKEIWDFYNKLKLFKINPDEKQKIELKSEFDLIFDRSTGYEALDKRLALTCAKKDNLLVVLDYPEVPLHNNLSENGVRELVIKRKISGGVKSEDGKTAWENNMTILATCKKLGVSFFEYMKNIFKGEQPKVSLAELILT